MKLRYFLASGFCFFIAGGLGVLIIFDWFTSVTYPCAEIHLIDNYYKLSPQDSGKEDEYLHFIERDSLWEQGDQLQPGISDVDNRIYRETSMAGIGRVGRCMFSESGTRFYPSK